MSKAFIPQGYKPVLNLYDTQRAIGLIKSLFQDNLSRSLSLHRVSAPLFVEVGTGLNDDLNGVERPVQFDMLDGGKECQVVQSLAKWKRKALRDYGFNPGNGLYTDMNAIRRDEELDNLHSIYVDQWDWEKVIRAEDRKIEYLQGVVRSIVNSEHGHSRYPRKPCQAVGAGRLPRTRQAALPRRAAGGQAAPYHWRRHWPKPPVHAASGQRPHWRGAKQCVGCRHPRDVPAGRHSPAVKQRYFQGNTTQ